MRVRVTKCALSVAEYVISKHCRETNTERQKKKKGHAIYLCLLSQIMEPFPSN